jgi:iron complex transport system ATP-binding protein
MLQTQNLSVGYQPNTVLLQDLNLSLHSHELVCILGANGSGKTTLLRSLAGLQKTLGGKILIQETELGQIPKRKKAQLISMVLTDKLATERLTLCELVRIGRYPHTSWTDQHSATDEQKIKNALEATQISHLANHNLFQLSDGQRQKALIARALAQDGGLLILDEPTAHLDLIGRYEIMTCLRNIAQAQHKAILVATHELTIALQEAHKLWIITPEGELLTGRAEDLALSGLLQKIFPTPNLAFNPHTGHFEPKHKRLLAFEIESESELASYWTETALRKLPLHLTNHSEKIPIQIRQNEEQKFVWLLPNHSYLSIDALCKGLEKELLIHE